jgi:23S rRNA (uracil1939-C5)-methyltransferase
MLSKNDTIELTIDDLTVEGAGIGRYEGMAVFIAHALPGEHVKVKIIKLAKSYAVARLVEILKPSPERVKPFCAVFEACGGCTLQHLSYKGQLEYKARYIKECFARLAGIDIETPEVVASENIRDYRNKASFPVAETGGRVQAGFYAPRSHRLVAADCPIQKQSVNDVKDAVVEWAEREGIKAYDEKSDTGTLRHIIGRKASSGDVMAGIVVRGRFKGDALVKTLQNIKSVKSVVINTNSEKTNAILGDKEYTLLGEPYITETFDGLSFRAGLSSFLQVSHRQAEKLYKLALDFAGISRDDIVFDLFCGIGTLSLLAARQAKRVLGIEYVPSAVENAKENARLNGIDNAEFLAGDAEQMLDEGINITGRPDIVILDPPRKGCDSKLIEKLTDIAPRKIVYVSCNPSTLARDATLFCNGGYGIDAVKGVDMFPHTTHVECCILLTRRE